MEQQPTEDEILIQLNNGDYTNLDKVSRWTLMMWKGKVNKDIMPENIRNKYRHIIDTCRDSI